MYKFYIVWDYYISFYFVNINDIYYKICIYLKKLEPVKAPADRYMEV